LQKGGAGVKGMIVNNSPEGSRLAFYEDGSIDLGEYVKRILNMYFTT